MSIFENAFEIRREVFSLRQIKAQLNRVLKEQMRLQIVKDRMDQTDSQHPMITSAAEAYALVLAITEATYIDTAPLEHEIARCQHEQLRSVIYQCPELANLPPACELVDTSADFATAANYNCLTHHQAEIDSAYSQCVGGGSTTVRTSRRFSINIDLSSNSSSWNASDKTAVSDSDQTSAQRSHSPVLSEPMHVLPAVMNSTFVLSPRQSRMPPRISTTTYASNASGSSS